MTENLKDLGLNVGHRRAGENHGFTTTLIKIGGRVVRHVRAITVQLAEVAVSGSMVRAPSAAIHQQRAPPSCA